MTHELGPDPRYKCRVASKTTPNNAEILVHQVRIAVEMHITCLVRLGLFCIVFFCSVEDCASSPELSERLRDQEAEVQLLKNVFVALLKQVSRSAGEITTLRDQNELLSKQTQSLANSVQRCELHKNRFFEEIRNSDATIFQSYLDDLHHWNAAGNNSSEATDVNFLFKTREAWAKLTEHDDAIAQLRLKVGLIWERLENMTNGHESPPQSTVAVVSPDATTQSIPVSTTKPVCSIVDTFVSYETLSSFHRDYFAMFGKDLLYGGSKIYYMKNFVSNILLEYKTEEDFLRNKNVVMHTLPLYCAGAQSAVVGGRLYCSQKNEPNILVYDLLNVSMPQTIPLVNVNGSTAGSGNKCPYGYGGFSDIDIEFDETGLYAIWGRANRDCQMAISKIDRQTLTIERTWSTTHRKRSGGGAFMSCGRLYHLSDFRGTARNAFMYDTRTGVGTTLRNLQFKNLYSGTFHLHYDPNEQILYAWDNRYPVKVSIKWKAQ